YIGTGLCKTKGDGTADAATTAGDDGILSGKRKAAHFFFREITRRAASAMKGAEMPKCCANSSGSPEAPKVSFTPTNSIVQGVVWAKASATALPSPPWML